jgi:ribonuclease HII
VAKVTRDRLMRQADDLYPGYFFAQNKGYPTAAHLAQLKVLGPSPIHRQSFAPVREASASSTLRSQTTLRSPLSKGGLQGGRGRS